MSYDTPGDPFGDSADEASSPPSTGPFVPGDVVGERYKIESVAGLGAHGRVYRATRQSDGTTVALKCTKLSAFAGRPWEAEFERMRRLSHPNVPAVYESFLDAKAQYVCVAMQFIEGLNLRSLLQKPVGQIRSAEMIADVSDALDYLHSQGLFHRDLKPENIVVDREGKAWLIDLGVSETDLRLLDREGQLDSTPHYASDAALTGDSRNVDWTGEVYSLGVILKEMLTAVPQVPASSSAPKEDAFVAAMMSRIFAQEFPDEISERLQEICTRSLDVRRADRYLTAKEFATDLRSFVEAERVKQAQEEPRDAGEDSISAWRAGRYVGEALSYAIDVEAALAMVTEPLDENLPHPQSTRLILAGTGLRESLSQARSYLTRLGARLQPEPTESAFQLIAYRKSRLDRNLLVKLHSDLNTRKSLLAEAQVAARDILSHDGDLAGAAYQARLSAERAMAGNGDSQVLGESLGQITEDQSDYAEFVAAIKAGEQPATLGKLLHALDREIERSLKSRQAPHT